MKIGLSGTLLLIFVLSLSCALGSVTGTELTVNTIRLSLAWYFLALLTMLRMGKGDWNATTTLGRLARGCWTWGAICFLLHFGMAFHFYHHWSHNHAFEHTREVSGLGEGIYFSYFFTALWILDVVWWWCWPTSYSVRSRWWLRLLHGYMLFIVFNGMVIFEDGVIRWVGAVMFSVLLIAWVQSLFTHHRRIDESYAM